MKKIGRFLLVLVLVLGVTFTTGCGKKETETTEPNETTKNTVASKLVAEFNDSMKKGLSVEDTANNIKNNEALGIATEAEEVTEDGFISGFKTEIKEYKNAYAIRPIIGSIPFIAYIFEAENAKEFETTLRENADLRWNICTEADNMETAVYNNYVFFVMAPESFD